MKRFKLENGDKWVEHVSIGLKDATQKGLLSAAQKTVAAIKTDIIGDSDPVPVDRGGYRAAWKASKHPQGAIVFNDSPYAAIVEDGARAENIKPSRKMVEAIAEWVRRKGIADTLATSPSGKVKRVKATTTAATNLAWAIVKSMQVRGIVGRKILDKATMLIPQFIREEVTASIKEALK